MLLKEAIAVDISIRIKLMILLVSMLEISFIKHHILRSGTSMHVAMLQFPIRQRNATQVIAKGNKTKWFKSCDKTAVINLKSV